MTIRTINDGGMDLSLGAEEAIVIAEALAIAAQIEDEERRGPNGMLYDALSTTFAAAGLACHLQREIVGGGMRLCGRTVKPPDRKASS